MLTIGEFARETGLSAKALRLYDEMTLVVPAEVDPANGYRYYEPAQVEPARLVARLRAAGVPLARIAAIVGADAPAVALAELLSYWRQVEADTASARAAVVSLVAELRGQDTTVNADDITTDPIAPTDPIPDPTAPGPVSAHRAGRGARDLDLDDVRPKVHRLAAQITGQRVFAVADGSGDRVGVATAALDALEDLDGVEPGPDPLGDLDAAVGLAAGAVDAAIEGSDAVGGSTLTALLLTEGRALIAHLGDSRAHLVRGGQLERLTRDHTAVQSLVEAGRLTDDEARSDPRRALLNRALGSDAPAAPDLTVRRVEPGDRFVLTTKGVHGVLDRATLGALLVGAGEPDTLADAVEAAVLAAGAPDNYGIVVVDA